MSNLKKLFNWNELSYFELNLETWRQLWRVIEMSDIVLVIVDIRFPVSVLLRIQKNHTKNLIGRL